MHSPNSALKHHSHRAHLRVMTDVDTLGVKGHLVNFVLCCICDPAGVCDKPSTLT